MAQRKRSGLPRGLETPQHRVVALDALADEGELSLAALRSRSIRSRAGHHHRRLLNYFDTAAVLACGGASPAC